MAASRDKRSQCTDIWICTICLKLLNSPKSLPCLHTFCLKCVEGLYIDDAPGDEAACPVCRHKFNIPQSGVGGLVGNFFIERLVEARKTASEVSVQAACEVCMFEYGGNNSNTVVSTMYCVDCNQKLCERCSTPHRRMKGGPHNVVSIGSGVETELIQMQSDKCDKHNDECVKLFCFDCMMNICMMCFAEEHQQHKCKEIKAFAAECVKQIDADMESANKSADGTWNEMCCMEEERLKLVSGVEHVREKLTKRGEELKRLIDAQVSQLMSELQSLKTDRCTYVEHLKANRKMKLSAFETFTEYCSELKQHGKPCDITRAANDLHTRCTQLQLQNDVTQEGPCDETVVFTSMNFQELLDCGQNFIGTVKLNEAAVTPSCISFVTPGEKMLVQRLAQSTDTELSLRQQIEECHGQLAANETDAKVKLEKSATAINKLKTCVRRLQTSDNNLKIKLEQSEREVKRLTSELEKAMMSENSLKTELKTSQLTDLEQRLRERERTVPLVVNTWPDVEYASGVASLNDELYVLIRKDRERVEIYSATTTAATASLSLQGCLSLPVVENNWWGRPAVNALFDMASCRRHRCLYVADYSRDCCVHRLELIGGTVTTLSVNCKLRGLSVTPGSCVLITCWQASRLLMLTGEGKQLCQIDLQSDIVHPQHAIQLPNGQFVLCHGEGSDDAHRVCIVDTNGHVTHSYGGPPGRATGQLNGPNHLAVDNCGFVFVADSNNSRVLLLSPTLSCVREIVSRSQLKGNPLRLFLDVDRRRLYVTVVGKVVVVQLW